MANVEEIGSMIANASEQAAQAQLFTDQAAAAIGAFTAQIEQINEGGTSAELNNIAAKAAAIHDSMQQLISQIVDLQNETASYGADLTGNTDSGASGDYREASHPTEVSARSLKGENFNIYVDPIGEPSEVIARRVENNPGDMLATAADMALLAAMRHTDPEAQKAYNRLLANEQISKQIADFITRGSQWFTNKQAPDSLLLLMSDKLREPVTRRGEYGADATDIAARSLHDQLHGRYYVRPTNDKETAFLADCLVLDLNKLHGKPELRSSLEARVKESWKRISVNRRDDFRGVFTKVINT